MNGNIQDSQQAIKAYLDRTIERGKIPGVQYLVMNKDKILFEYYKFFAWPLFFLYE